MEPQEKTNYLKKLIKSCQSRISNNNTDLHVIIYSCNRVFEYQPYSETIQPFNSIIWYKIDDTKFYNILEYIRDKYDLIKSTQFSNSDISGLSDIGGCIINNTLLIKTDLFKDALSKNKENLVNEYDEFIDYINSKYTEWDDMVRFVLDNYDRSKVEMLFDMKRG